MIDKKKFLIPPFKTKKIVITEGWLYSKQEKAIHGRRVHGGIDYELPQMTPILASADGWAIGSYEFSPLSNRKTYKGKPIGMGYGFHIRVYHPQFSNKSEFVFSIYGHLAKIHPKIKFHKPRIHGDIFNSGIFIIPFSKITNPKFASKVRQGQIIGYSGDSGLSWGYIDYPKRPDPKKFPSWDEPHLHFEIYTKPNRKTKKAGIDPYGIYKNATAYRNVGSNS